MINLEIFRQTLKNFSSKSVEGNAVKMNQPKSNFERRSVDIALVEFLRASVKAATDENVKQIICGLGICQATKKATSEGAAVIEVTGNKLHYVKALSEYGELDLKESASGNVSQFTISSESLNEVTARIMNEFLLPPNCYDSDGIITTSTGKRYRYVDIAQWTTAPVEIKTAPGDCSKCTYRKARGTKYDSCAKCPELTTYFEWTHSNVYTTPAQMIIFKCGLSPYEEILKIGYDPTTLEIILPLTRRQYVTLELANRAASSVEDFKDRENARRILSHYNLNPRRNAELTLDGHCNFETPFLDNRFIGTKGEIIFATCIGQVYKKINLPFPPTEEIKILQPYKV